LFFDSIVPGAWGSIHGMVRAAEEKTIWRRGVFRLSAIVFDIELLNAQNRGISKTLELLNE
jgi:hypothetical protein